MERYGLCGKDIAFGIHQLDQHVVLATWHARQDNCVALAEIRPQPWQVIHRDVQMADAGRQVASGRPCHGQDAHVLQPVWDDHDALGQRSGKWELYDQSGRGLVIDGDDCALGEGTGGDRGVFGKRRDQLLHAVLSFDNREWRTTRT